MDKAVNKKEYLKKYLSGGGDKKKKRKKISSSNTVTKSRIIDDDIDFTKMRSVDENEIELYGLGEDAPQIAGYIDDRPEEVRLLSEYRETKKWKIVAKEYEDAQIMEIGGSDSDLSPSRPRQNTVKGKSQREKNDSDSDVSVKRRKADSDNEAPRKKHISKKRHGNSSGADVSPPRRKKLEKHSRSENGDDSDPSPPRRKTYENSDSDHSPPRKRKHNDDRSYKKKRRDDSDEEPPRRHRHVDKDNRKSDAKASRTLDGKKAGLQDASELRKEAEEIRRRQAHSLAQLGDELSGRGAAAIFRDKKTGRKRDLVEEARQKRERQEKEAEAAAKYAVWGKGVKQVDDREAKMKSDLHEMAKPLARYKDDIDLDEMLRNEEKEGDPMLEYIRAKKQKEGTEKPKPQYQGSYMPNRYNIKPGYRWDGVDRSNGYEKKYFDEINARKARDEEAFKWSTEDM